MKDAQKLDSLELKKNLKTTFNFRELYFTCFLLSKREM